MSILIIIYTRRHCGFNIWQKYHRHHYEKRKSRRRDESVPSQLLIFSYHLPILVNICIL
jgi:hypothetical protein